MPGPLHGVKVLDFTEIIAGPLAGMLLGDMGADVIKIEPPWGDPWRHTQSFRPSESRGFLAFNRGKRSLPLDLTKPEAQEILHRLVPQADVVLVNYRPDVATKLGVAYETLTQLNPRLIYCEITAYGRRGPDAHRPGYDMILQAITGLMAAETKLMDGIPQQVWSTPLIDMAAGIFLAGCASAALYAREHTGCGQKVETSLLGAALALLGTRLVQVESLDRENRVRALAQIAAGRANSAPYQELLALSPGARRLLHHGNIYYRVYLTRDGPIAVGCLSDPLRRQLLEVLSLQDIRFQPGYDPNAPEAQAFGRALEQQAEALFLEKTTGEWLAILEERGIPAGPVRFVEELFADQQVLANGLIVEVEHRDAGKVQMAGPLADFSGTPPAAASASPALGQHTAEVLGELGYSLEEVRHFREAGAVG